MPLIIGSALAPRRHRGSALLAAALAAATLAGVLGCGSLTSPPASGASPVGATWSSRGALGAADGAVPNGVTAFDDELPAVANLDPALLDALRQASTAARRDGVVIHVSSGWRSAAYQQQLLDEAVSTYGSEAEAARWVATPSTSPHVAGDAIDVGGTAAMTWLSQHGSEHGLCQIYRNEPWHYELRPASVDHGCPAPYADPTHDPRMQK